ncbi:hypothetical protein H4CHR_04375 [Variovorax sp. PBS-H4]|uniref:DUF4376 domain-containing protein n=1 Tax=Variovorax sp. PBS-H4 TaxID=434008 RepID=UPI001317506C|nr:DUF4376 domain-containing protein [Variovorax sp. PBS-H4]VTU38243.1 hypothetical protein H4CHR_04375 [Variovorax sp. PBS-H4]
MEIYPYSIIGDHGQVLSTGTTNDLSALPGNVIPQAAPPEHWWDASRSTFVPMGIQITPYHVWDWPTHEWVSQRTTEMHRGDKWREIKAAREAYIVAGVHLPGLGRFDADAKAALNMTGTFAALDSMPDDWTIDWTRFDNSSITLTKDQFRMVALRVLAHANFAHAIGRRLRDRIESSTGAALEAVAWGP